ncbi:MAG: HAMP domain-containing protein [Nocardioidaceae bacterium]|nr:HAMP domain-containing protein [Nocardioidaceae bacterium]
MSAISSRLRLRTVRARATALATLVVAAALTIGALGLVFLLRMELVKDRDAAAETRVRDLASLAEAGALQSPLTVPTDDDFAQVVDASGTVIAAGPVPLETPPVASFPADRNEPTVRTLTDVPDGDDEEGYRVWALRADTDDGPVTVYVGASLSSVEETLATLQGLLAGGLPVLLVAFAGTAWWLLGRALRPVEQIRAEVERISGDELHRRVPRPQTDDEIGRLAATMNTMLDRLQAASEQQRTFVADAAHELQSPLTALRTQLEVALVDPTGTDWSAVARAALGDNAELEHLVRDLLFLARVEESDAGRRTTLVDLDDVVLEEAARVGTTSPVPIDTRGVSAAPIRGSREELARMTRNLLENACRHASAQVVVGLGEYDGGVRLAVHDDGAGVPVDERERIFERFFRSDRARARDEGRTGLGLAIVKAIVLRSGGSVQVEDGDPGARFVVILPSAA